MFSQISSRSLVIPLLKKFNLDKENLSNYRPISHLSFLSKLTERVVKQRLTHHLSSNGLLNSFQSAYTKHHSTESTLLAVHDHLIKAMGQQKVTALCLLDLCFLWHHWSHYSSSSSILLVCLNGLYSLGSNHIFHLKILSSMLKDLNQHLSPFNKEFLKGPSWVLFSSSFILLLSVPSSLIPWLNIISMLMTLNFSFLLLL